MDEVRAVLGGMAGTHQLLAKLMYNSGLRVLECSRLRAKDVDFDRHQIAVRDGKGEKDHVVPLPRRLEAKLHAQSAKTKALQAPGLAAVYRRVWFGGDCSRRGLRHASRTQNQLAFRRADTFAVSTDRTLYGT